MPKRKPMLIAIGFLLAATAGCPYQLVRQSRADLPSGLKSLSIPLARNSTIEAGLDDMFTQELIKRFRADGRAMVTPAGQGEAELRCRLTGLVTFPASYSQEGRISAETALIMAECRLVVPGSEAEVWNSGLLVSAEEYPVGDDYLANEDAKAAALALVCRDLSEIIRSALLDAF